MEERKGFETENISKLEDIATYISKLAAIGLISFSIIYYPGSIIYDIAKKAKEFYNPSKIDKKEYQVH